MEAVHIVLDVDAGAILDFAHDVHLVLVVPRAVTLFQSVVQFLQCANVAS